MTMFSDNDIRSFYRSRFRSGAVVIESNEDEDGEYVAAYFGNTDARNNYATRSVLCITKDTDDNFTLWINVPDGGSGAYIQLGAIPSVDMYRLAGALLPIKERPAPRRRSISVIEVLGIDTDEDGE